MQNKNRKGKIVAEIENAELFGFPRAKWYNWEIVKHVNYKLYGT